MILSTELLNFDARFEGLVAYFTENVKRFGYTELQMKALDKHWGEWKVAFKRYCHPVTHNDTSTVGINDCYELCYKIVMALKLKAFHSILTLTSEDKAFLELNSNTKTVGKIPVTDYAPNLVCLENAKSFCKFFAFDPKYLGTKRKPAGADSIRIMVAYTLVDEIEPDKEAYNKINPSRKSIFEIPIATGKAGWYFISKPIK